MEKKSMRGEGRQVASKKFSTTIVGGDAPNNEDIVESANARAQKRHDVKGSQYADEEVLPSSGGQVLDKAGIQDTGYLVKKNLEYGVNAFYNSLPPGMDIEDQEIADIRSMEMKQITDLGYPGDGWT